ncbi:MAG: hypothetical protein ACK55Z_04430, partial [bacterium]
MLAARAAGEAAGAQRVVDHEHASRAGGLEVAGQRGLVGAVVAADVEELRPEGRHDLRPLRAGAAYGVLRGGVFRGRPGCVEEKVEEGFGDSLGVGQEEAGVEHLARRLQVELGAARQSPADLLAQACDALLQLLVSLVCLRVVIERLGRTLEASDVLLLQILVERARLVQAEFPAWHRNVEQLVDKLRLLRVPEPVQR